MQVSPLRHQEDPDISIHESHSGACSVSCHLNSGHLCSSVVSLHCCFPSTGFLYLATYSKISNTAYKAQIGPGCTLSSTAQLHPSSLKVQASRLFSVLVPRCLNGLSLAESLARFQTKTNVLRLHQALQLEPI